MSWEIWTLLWQILPPPFYEPIKPPLTCLFGSPLLFLRDIFVFQYLFNIYFLKWGLPNYLKWYLIVLDISQGSPISKLYSLHFGFGPCHARLLAEALLARAFLIPDNHAYNYINKWKDSYWMGWKATTLPEGTIKNSQHSKAFHSF